MNDRVQWRTLGWNEFGAFRFVVGLIVNEDFDKVHEKLLDNFRESTLTSLVNKGVLVREDKCYSLGAEGKRLAMLHKLAPQFNWKTQ